MIRRRAPWLRALAAGVGGAMLLIPSLPAPRLGASGEPAYTLYYAFDLPLALPGITLTDEGTKHTYSGTLRGTLGGLPVTSASYTYGSGATAVAGGGTFSLVTSAGAVRDGRILMTTEKQHTTLSFFGTYLGSSLTFTITSDQQQIGGAGVSATGLAETGFRSHDQYIAAIREATASRAPSERDHILAEAEQNPRLVREYQQKPPTQ